MPENPVYSRDDGHFIYLATVELGFLICKVRERIGDGFFVLDQDRKNDIIMACETDGSSKSKASRCERSLFHRTGVKMFHEDVKI
jgi:hypothetical protein